MVGNVNSELTFLKFNLILFLQVFYFKLNQYFKNIYLYTEYLLVY